MRSTRRSEAYAGVAALLFMAGAVLVVALFLPPEPTTPRWQGAGHETPQRGGTFVFFHESDLRGLDPQRSFDEISIMGIKLLYEGLIDYDRDSGQLEPRLAEAMPELSADGRTYTFRLRRGIHFADSEVFEGGHGREVTAEDVRWSLEHMLDPATACPGATFYGLIEGLEAYQSGEASHIAGIRVRDRYTFEIRLREADQTFIYAMAMIFAYPVAREAYARWGDQVARHPVGTGAYVLESWEPGVQAVFARNPSYFIEGQPYVDRMVYTLNLDRRPAAMRFRNGDLDHLHRMTPADYRKLEHMDAWAPYRQEYPLTDIWGVIMNCQLAPFDDRHVRRAVAYAINPDEWRRARSDRLLITGQPIPRTLPGYEDELPEHHHLDLAKAREEMRLAGHPDELADPVEVWLGEGDTGRAYGELIQHDLAAIGIRVEIKQVAFPIYLQETGKPRTAQLLLSGWSMDYPDPSNFLDVLFHSRSIHERDSTNRAFYSNPELDHLLDQARVEPDPARRHAMYQHAQEILVEDAPWAFVFSNLMMEMWQPYVRNYRPHPVWSNFYRDVWLDLPRQRWAWGPRGPGPAGRLAAFAPLAGGLLP